MIDFHQQRKIVQFYSAGQVDLWLHGQAAVACRVIGAADRGHQAWSAVRPLLFQGRVHASGGPCPGHAGPLDIAVLTLFSVSAYLL